MVAIRMLGAAGAGLIMMVGAAAQAPTPANPWTLAAPFPNPSEEVLGASANGKLYVFAGLAPGWKPKALVFEYDPAGNAWAQKKPMPMEAHHVALVTLNDKIYAFGGFRLPDNAPLPSPRGAAAAAVAGGRIYVTGGATSLPGVTEAGIHPARPHHVLANVDEYDPATNSWRARRPLLVPRNHHVAAGIGDKLYVAGGRIGAAFISGGSNNIDLLEMYDPAADLWVPRDKMPTRRSAMGAGIYKGQLIVAGGEYQDRFGFTAYRAVEAYNPALNQWTLLPSMRHPRHGLAVGVVGDRLYAVSGDGQSAGSGAHSTVPFTEALQLDLLIR